MRISIEYHAKWSITHSSRLYQKLALNFVVNHQPSHGQIKKPGFFKGDDTQDPSWKGVQDAFFLFRKPHSERSQLARSLFTYTLED